MWVGLANKLKTRQYIYKKDGKTIKNKDGKKSEKHMTIIIK